MPKLSVEKTSPRNNPCFSQIPDTAFDKISIDIMGSLPTTESGHSYISTIQDLLTKYLAVVPFKQAMSTEITKTLVEKFINLYTTKVWITDQSPIS